MTQDTHTVLTELKAAMDGALTNRLGDYSEGFDAGINLCIALIEEKRK